MDNEQLRIKEYDEAMALLDAFKKQVESGELMSVMIVGETTNGELCGGTTSTQNQFAVAGYLMTWAMRRLGFTQFQDVRIMLGNG